MPEPVLSCRMSATALLRLSASEIARRVAAREVTARALAEAALARAEAVGASTGAFVTIAHEPALAAADAVDRALEEGHAVGTLAGVPFVAKDNLCTPGVRTTAGSRILADFVPPYAATAVARLQAAGAVLIAKADMDEFGMGSSSETSAFGPVRNPWDVGRVAGGSSGGSAVAVASGVVPLALGTDTGGSVRQPAAFCGVLGFKPTYGTLSRHGVVAYGSSLDQVGVLARNAADVGLAMDAMVGQDPCDATTVDVRAEFGAAAAREADLEGVRVGVVRELAGEGNEPAVTAASDATVRGLEALGAEVREVGVPSARAGVACYYLIASAEASSNLARYDGAITGARSGDEASGQAEVMTRSRAAGFGMEVRRRVLMGAFALSAGHVEAWYGRALAVRRKVADELDAAFEEADLLLTPTVPGSAFALGEKREDPLAMYLGDVDTCLANLAGIGAISVPGGRDEAGLPVGVQLMAPALRDGDLLRAAAALHRAGGDDFVRIAEI